MIKRICGKRVSERRDPRSPGEWVSIYCGTERSFYSTVGIWRAAHSGETSLGMPLRIYSDKRR